jgi:glycosyltransferase involved in cell wall biosynthesis
LPVPSSERTGNRKGGYGLTMPEAPSVTVIIPTFNEEGRLGRCLESVTRQDYPPDRLEILVVDDDSTDGTVEIARSFGARVLRNGEHNIERGKSIGARAAAGDLILLMDADNSLPEPGWLSCAAAALRDNPEAAGAQSAWFDYSRDDPTANRYCALFGINDPFAYYLRKRDKLTWFEKDWEIVGELLVSEDDYFLVRFTASDMPTIGSQGYLISRELLQSTDYVPYLFHMEMNLELVRRGRDTFVMLRSSIAHDHCSTAGVLLSKLRRNFNLFLEQREIRSYRWESTALERAGALVRMLTVIVPLVDSVRGYRSVRDRAWFLHPAICVAVPSMYAYLYCRWQLTHRGRRPAPPR